MYDISGDTMQKILEKQKKLFNTGQTQNYKYRVIALNRIKMLIELNEDKILNALQLDLNKHRQEAYMSEIGLVYDEIRLQLKLVKRFAKKKRVKTPTMLLHAKSYYEYRPYGTTLIIGPFNYPLQLVLIPLIGAIAAGNTVIVKCSEKTSHLSNLLVELFNDNFNEEYIYFTKPELNNEELNQLLDYKYDLIFFTGSYKVGQIILKKAAQHLTPTILELGGKSPCIIDASANLKMSAKRIVWGKLINAGQTCIAPDYILVHQSVKDELIKHIISEIKSQKQDDETVKIIDKNSLNRLIRYLEGQEIIYGGNYNLDDNKFDFTLLNEPSFSSSVMSEEIFGPILPVISYENINDLVDDLKVKDRPLVVYYFGNNIEVYNKVNNEITSGALIQNDTLIHASNNNLPFGGVGHSGMFHYHGPFSYEAFSYKKAHMKRSNFIEFNMRFMPYDKKKENIIKRLLK